MSVMTLFRKLEFTNEWQVRCPSCGRTKRGGETGMIRIASRRSIGKRVLGYCNKCSGMKFLIIEPAAPSPAPPPKKKARR